MKRIMHLLIAVMALVLIVAYYADWLAVTPTMGDSYNFTPIIDHANIVWVIYGFALLSFLAGFIGAQCNSKSVMVHIVCSLFAFLGTAVLCMDLMNKMAVARRAGAECQLLPAFYIGIAAQVLWFSFSILARAKEDMAAVDTIKEVKPKIEHPAV